MPYVQATVDIEASPEQVWSYLTKIERWPDWAFKRGPFLYPVLATVDSGVEDDLVAKVQWCDESTSHLFCREWISPRFLRFEARFDFAPVQGRQWIQYEIHPLAQDDSWTWLGLDVEWEIKAPLPHRAGLTLCGLKKRYLAQTQGVLDSLRDLMESEIVKIKED